MQYFLFIGGQHHGSMLPVCDQSLRDTFNPPRPSELGRSYCGYRQVRIRLAGGGDRLFFVNEKYVDNRQLLANHLVDGLCAALDNYERVIAHYKDNPRRILPLNEALYDERGREACLTPRQAVKRGSMEESAGRM